MIHEVVTRDAHFSGFEFLVEKREKWSISRREKSRNREKLYPNTSSFRSQFYNAHHLVFQLHRP